MWRAGEKITDYSYKPTPEISCNLLFFFLFPLKIPQSIT